MAKSKAVAMPRDEYASVSVRKIDNGYLISRSTSGPKGYSCTETYSPTKPKLDLPAASPAAKPAKSAPASGAGALRKVANGGGKKR